MDKFRTDLLGGLPFVLDDIRQFLGRLTSPANHGIYQAFNNILRGYGDNFIIQGCILSGSTGAFSITEGWIMLGGELIKVDAQGPFNEAVNGTFTKVTTFDPRGNKQFLNGSIADTYEKNRGVISGLAGTLAFDADRFAELNIVETLDASSVVGTTRFKKKKVEIGDWNMVATISVLVDHEISDFSKIITVKASIIADDSAIIQPLNKFTSSGIEGGVVFWNSTIIGLQRETGGFFDSTAYDATSFNRGHLIIEHEA